MNLAQEYLGGQSTAQLAIKYKVSQNCIIRRLKKQKVSLRGNTKYDININYLDQIDASQKAYFLGFAISDGHIYKPKGKNTWRFTLEILASDDQVLHRFNSMFSYNKPLVYRQRLYKPTASFIVYNQDVCQQMLKNGVIPQKTFQEKYPYLDPGLDRHFIRGIFDGDGCISGSLIIKNSVTMCRQIQDILFKQDIISKVYIHNYSQPLGVLAIHDKSNLIKMREYLYQDAQVFLSRKKDIFDSIEFKGRAKKLSIKQVKEIKGLISGQVSDREISERYPVSRRNITNIRNNIIWKNV